jgi:hypothetical protein
MKWKSRAGQNPHKEEQMSHEHTDHEANRKKQDVTIPHAPDGESSVEVNVADDRPEGDRVVNPNSKAKADLGVPYEQIPRPKNPGEAVAAIDVWARYLHNWGRRVDQEFHGLYLRLQAAGNPKPQAAGTATMHLDPPPEPFK